MRHCQALSFAVLAALTAALGSGCGDSTASGTVSGEVLYAGAPVEHATIQFTPKDGKGVAAGGKVVAGKYSVPNVPLGTVTVSVTPTAEAMAGPMSSEDSAREAAERAASKKKFTPKPPSFPVDAGGNKVTFEVKAGQNTFKMELTTPRPR